MFQFNVNVIRVVHVPATIWKVVRAPIFEEVLLKHAALSFRITPNPEKQRKSPNSLVDLEYMQKIPTGTN
jgi:hypothetical protein